MHRLSCSVACRIFPDQGSNPCPLIGRRILNHCATREAAFLYFFCVSLPSLVSTLAFWNYHYFDIGTPTPVILIFFIIFLLIFISFYFVCNFFNFIFYNLILKCFSSHIFIFKKQFVLYFPKNGLSYLFEGI